MESARCFWMCSSSAILFFFLFILVPASSSPSTYVLDSIFITQPSAGRSLLQAKKACPVNFEFLDYVIITSKCKGPKYPPDLCCSALKEFACPYAEELNDLTNDCASTMFSYINLNGKYPPGLFSSECQEGKEGIACPAGLTPTPEKGSWSQMTCYPSLLGTLAAAFLLLSQLL